jgi:putative ABC transport system ATP-binding protein
MALSARRLHKTYTADGVATDAVRGIDLDVAAGELVAVMGPSGCGKSTLLHLLGGLARPTSGEVTVQGQSLADLDDDDLASFRGATIGFVFQAHNLLPSLTVAENVALPATLLRRTARRATTRVDELLDALGLADVADRRVHRLSGGEQQRVAVARALVMEPAVLLADEPTGALDSTTTFEVLRLLRQVHRDGQTIVLVTHDPKVAGIADRILRLRDGQLVEEHRPGVDADIDYVVGRIVDTAD